MTHIALQAQEGFASIPEPSFYFDFEENREWYDDDDRIFLGHREVFPRNYVWPHVLAMKNAAYPRQILFSPDYLTMLPRFHGSRYASLLRPSGSEATSSESAYGVIQGANSPDSPGPSSVLYQNNQGIKNLTMACWVWFSSTDLPNSKRLIFYGRQSNATTLSIGLAHDRTGKITMVRSAQAGEASVNYEVAYRSPVSFDAGTGWYFVAFTQTEFTTRVYVGKPDGTFACQLMLTGSQDYSHTANTGIGSPNLSYESVKAVDDLMIWQTALSGDQLNHIYHCSHTQSPMTCWGGESGTVSTDARKITEVPIPVEEPPLQTLENMLAVYPNPSSNGNFTIDLTITEDTPVAIQVISLQGSILSERKEQVSKGAHRFSLNAWEGSCGCSNTPNAGVYLLKVKTNQLNEVRRLVVQY